VENSIRPLIGRLPNNVNDLANTVRANQAAIFDIRRRWGDVMSFFGNISFLGEVVKEHLFVTMLHQLQTTDSGTIVDLTKEQADEWAQTGDISGFNEHFPFSWTFWQINLETGEIIGYLSFNGRTDISPFQNFQRAQEQVQIRRNQEMSIRFNVGDLKHYERQMFKDLFIIVEHSRTNNVLEFSFSRKVFVNFMTYWGIINNKNFLLDEFKDTQPPVVVKLDQNYTMCSIDNDPLVMEILTGTPFSFIDYARPTGVTKRFNTYKELHNYIYSLSNFIHHRLGEFGLQKGFNELHKRYNGNVWPISETEDEKHENRDNLTRYEVSITKYNTELAVRVIVKEYGVVYLMTNFPDVKVIPDQKLPADPEPQPPPPPPTAVDRLEKAVRIIQKATNQIVDGSQDASDDETN